MACEEDLAEVMRNALEHSGDLALLHVQLEEKLVSLNNQQELPQRPSSSGDVAKPTMPSEVLLVNELIREYLNSTGCDKTASVLVTESGLPSEPMSRTQLKAVLAPGKNMDRNRPLLKIIVDQSYKK